MLDIVAVVGVGVETAGPAETPGWNSEAERLFGNTVEGAPEMSRLIMASSSIRRAGLLIGEEAPGGRPSAFLFRDGVDPVGGPPSIQ